MNQGKEQSGINPLLYHIEFALERKPCGEF